MKQVAVDARRQSRGSFNPDFEKLKALLQGKGRPDELVFFEWYIDPGVATAAAGRFFEAPGRSESTDQNEYDFECSLRLARLLRLHNLPYCVCQKILHMLPKAELREPVGDFGAKDIAWDDIRQGPFGVGSPFEMIDWQGGIALASHEYIGKSSTLLPEGMKLSVGLPGVMEIASAILGIEEFYLGFYTNPGWTGEFLSKIGEATVQAVDEITQYPACGCLVLADDMGARTGLLVSSELLMTHVLPYHRKCAEVAHGRGVPVVLHSCGNVTEIMNEEIEYVGIDAKQSFDDNALPVEEFKNAFGGRVIALGGLDMTILSGPDEQKIRDRTRQIMQHCWGDGRYALGSGHCVATYTPIENFLAMQDEALKLAMVQE